MVNSRSIVISLLHLVQDFLALRTNEPHGRDRAPPRLNPGIDLYRYNFSDVQVYNGRSFNLSIISCAIQVPEALVLETGKSKLLFACAEPGPARA